MKTISIKPKRVMLKQGLESGMPENVKGVKVKQVKSPILKGGTYGKDWALLNMTGQAPAKGTRDYPTNKSKA